MSVRSRIVSLACISVFAAGLGRAQGIITTFAGADVTYPGTSFSALSASFGELGGVAVSPSGDVYFASQSRHMILRFNPALNSVSIFAGTGTGGYSGDGGPAASATLNEPEQIIFDSAGNLYIADTQNSAVRKIDTHGIITTFLTVQEAVNGIAFGPDGSLYVSGYSQIYHANLGGTVSVIAGSQQSGFTGDGGPAINALFNGMEGLVFDHNGNLFVADRGNNRIRRIDTNGNITTVVGNGQNGGCVNGPATSSPLSNPVAPTVDAQGNLYFGTGWGELIKVNASGVLSLLNPDHSTFFLSSPGPIARAQFANPEYVAFDHSGNLYATDGVYLWQLSAAGTVQIAAAYAPNFGIGDNGPDLVAGLNFPNGLWLAADGSLLVVDQYNDRIRRISASGTITTVAGNGIQVYTNPGPALSISLPTPQSVASDSSGNIYVNCGPLWIINPSGVMSQFNQGGFSAITVDARDNVLVTSYGNQVFRIAQDGTATVIAGTGQAGFSGDGGPATAAQLNNLQGIAVDSAGNIYIADNGNARIRKITPDGNISTIAGGPQDEVDGVMATESAVYPNALAIDKAGNLYDIETYNNRIRLISPNGIISAIAGTPFSSGFTGDGGLATEAALNQPAGVAVDAAGNIYIADRLNNRIREVLATPPSISVSSTQVTISAPSFGAPTQSDITLSSSVQGLQYSISFTTESGGDWLGFSSLQGQAPGVLSVIADPSTLAPNTYHGTITITNPHATPQTQTIQVTFEVSTQVSASMAVGTGPLYFALAVGNAPASSQLTVSNQGGGSLSFSASAVTATGGAWLQVSPGSGSATAGAPASLTVTATPAGLPVGTYSGSITIASGTTGQTLTIPVTLAINPALQKIVLSQTGLTFTAVAQGGSVIPQSIGIFNGGTGSMTWTATVSTLSGSGWLNVSSTTGTVAQPLVDVSFIDVSVNAQGLAAGQYFGMVQVTAPGASNAPQRVVIVLNVLPVGSNPGPELRPTGLVFTAVAGGANSGSQIVTIANTTSTPVVYGSGVTYVNGSGWISYQPTNASVTPDTLAQIAIQPNFANLAPGVYRSALTLAFDDGSVRTVSILAVLAPAAATGDVSSSSSLAPDGEKPHSQGTCTPTKLLPIFTQVATGPSVSTGYPVAVQADVVDDCGSPMNNGSVVVSFTDGDAPLSMINLQNGQWSATWQPQNSSPAGVTVSLLAQKASLVGTTQTLVGFQGSQSLPLASGGVFNAVTLAQGPLAPGELILIKGSALADGQAAATSTPLAQQLAGAQVLMGSGVASLLYADSTQLIGQVPFGTPVNTSQQIVLERDTSSGVPTTVIVAAAQPALFTADGSGTGQALVYQVNSSGVAGNLANASNPVDSGDTVIIYCAGLGAVDQNGAATNPVSVSIGGQPAHVAYAGIATPASYPSAGPPAILGLVSTGLGGLYQINAVVPAGFTAAAASVIVTVGGQSSQLGVTMSVVAGTSGGGQTPVPQGVLNAASYAKNSSGSGSAVAPGSLIQIYSSLPGATQAVAVSAPFPISLGGVSVTFDGISAPIQSVFPSSTSAVVNAQVPFEITGSSATMVLTVNGTPSAPVTVPVTPQAPGIFTVPPDGQHNAVFIYIDPTDNTAKVAAPASESNLFGIPAAPIPRGSSGFFYATGLGALAPPVADGAAPGSTDTTLHNAALKPTALVGGIKAQVEFAGQAPGYPGVNQINIVIPGNAPTGNAVPLQLMSGDGKVLSTAGATIAVQ